VPALRRDLPALTGLRFFLALWVILHHLTGSDQHLASVLSPVLPAPLFTLIRGGYQAVTTFFVLSGFVLTRSHWTDSWTGAALRQYYRGRVARVYPVYLLSLLVVTPFILDDRTPGKIGYALAHLTLTQAWLGAIPVQWNTPAWSLSCEMFFYAVFPLLGVFLVRRTSWRWVLGAGTFACLLTRVMEAAGLSDGIKPLVHLSDFLMGICAACAFELLQRRPRLPRAWWLYLPGFAGTAAAIAWADLLPAPLDLNSVLRPFNALLLIGLALGCPALSGRILVYLGKSSYAMYILHIPILWWYLRKSNTFSSGFYILLVIGICAMVYALVEEPANRRLRSCLKRPLAAAAAMLAVAIPIPGRAQSPTFEVASVRPSEQPWLQIAPQRTGGRVSWTTDLAYIISYAYHLPRWRISGPIPGSEYLYTIEATAAPAATEDQVRLMFQALLGDRFKMTSHRVSREANGYLLTVAKGGPKIHEVKDGDQPAPMPEWLPRTDAARLEGKVVATMPGRGVTAITMRRATISHFCEGLERALQTFVLDETGLKGNYYLALRFAGADAPPDTDAPTLLGAVAEFGLKLERRKGPLETLVIDHIETTPTAN
jgi:uncharacterized protein (TIGR03435 family)